MCQLPMFFSVLVFIDSLNTLMVWSLCKNIPHLHSVKFVWRNIFFSPENWISKRAVWVKEPGTSCFVSIKMFLCNCLYYFKYLQVSSLCFPERTWSQWRHPSSHCHTKCHFEVFLVTHPLISDNAKHWTHKIYQKCLPFNDQGYIKSSAPWF